MKKCDTTQEVRKLLVSGAQERSVYLQGAQLPPQELIALATHKIMTRAHSSRKETVDWSFKRHFMPVRSVSFTCLISSLRMRWKMNWLSCMDVWGSGALFLVTTSRLEISATQTKLNMTNANKTMCWVYIVLSVLSHPCPFTLVKQPLRESPSTKQARNGEPSVCSRASALKRCSAATSTCLEGNENKVDTRRPQRAQPKPWGDFDWPRNCVIEGFCAKWPICRSLKKMFFFFTQHTSKKRHFICLVY